MRAIMRIICIHLCRACYNSAMPNLMQMLKSRWQKRSTENLAECLHLWYQTGVEVSEICGIALYDQSAVQADIGVLLDRADRKLFQYRNDASDARRRVGKYDKALAERISTITGQVYELRNQTTRFLIRSQGPHLFVAEPDADRKDEYYQRSLYETGLNTREFKTALDKDMHALWVELEKLIQLAENKI